MGQINISKANFAVVAGQTYRFEIDAPSGGTVLRAQCVEMDGNKTTFQFAFFCSAVSCPPGQATTAGDNTVDPTTEYNGQIGPSRIVNPANDRYVLPNGSDGGWQTLGQYVNTDDPNIPQNKLYMKFIAGGNGTFSAFLTIRT